MMVRHMKANGHKVNSMDKERIYGMTDLLMKEHTSMAKNMDSVNMYILQEKFIKENGFKGINMVEEVCSTKKVMFVKKEFGDKEST